MLFFLLNNVYMDFYMIAVANLWSHEQNELYIFKIIYLFLII